jgi:serine/threonine protein kinase
VGHLPLVGAVLGDYGINRLVGSGATSVVYEATHRRRGQLVAIKLMQPPAPFADPGKLVEIFLNEIECLQRLRGCPYIVQLQGWGLFAHRQPYYVMNYLEGQTLEQALAQQGPYTPLEAFVLLRQLCIALQHVHLRGMLHLDLKPANILLQERQQPRVVLLDFGLASQGAPDASSSPHAVGTPLFAAPEQVEDRPADYGPATDIYALGMLAYVMLAGREPYDLKPSDDVVSVMRLRLHRVPLPLRARLPDTDPGIGELIDSCLEVAPDRRPASANAFIERFADRLGIDPVSDLSCGDCGRQQTCGLVPPLLIEPNAAEARPASVGPLAGDSESPRRRRGQAKDPALFAVVPPRVGGGQQH